MEIQQARAFLAVAREGSVSRAAERVGRSQPSVTMAVQKAERELGAKLVERIGRGIRLTSAGLRLAEYLGPLLEQWDSTRARLDESRDGVLRGPVRLGAGEAAILFLLPEALRTFRARHPQVDLVLRHEPSEQVLAGLRDGSLDFGIRSMPAPPATEFEFRPMLTCDRVVIVKRGNAAAPKATLKLQSLSGEPFVLPRKGSSTRALIEGAFAGAGIPLRIAVESGGWEIVKRYVAMGFGISVIPEVCLQPADLKRLAHRSARALFGQETYGIVTRRGRELAPAARLLVELLSSTRRDAVLTAEPTGRQK